MILSERNKQVSVLYRKYKPISMSLIIQKPLVKSTLPPLQIQASMKFQLKKTKPRLEFEDRKFSKDDTNIFKNNMGLNGLKQNISPKVTYVPYQRKELFQFPMRQKQLSKCKTEQQYKLHVNKINEVDTINKWSQTTFDEDQLLEYLNN